MDRWAGATIVGLTTNEHGLARPLVILTTNGYLADATTDISLAKDAKPRIVHVQM